MKFVLASLAWICIAAALGVGIWLFAVKGIVWLLATVAILFIFAVGKIGCATH